MDWMFDGVLLILIGDSNYIYGWTKGYSFGIICLMYYWFSMFLVFKCINMYLQSFGSVEWVRWMWFVKMEGDSWLMFDKVLGDLKMFTPPFVSNFWVCFHLIILIIYWWIGLRFEIDLRIEKYIKRKGIG